MWISLDSFCLRQSAFPISDLLLPRFDNFSAIISCNNSLCFFLFLILLGPPIMLMLVGLMLSQSSFESFSIFLILVSFYSGCMTFIYLCSDSLIHHSVSSKLLVFSSIFWFIVFFENLTVFTHFFSCVQWASLLSLSWTLCQFYCLYPLHLVIFLRFCLYLHLEHVLLPLHFA